MRLLARSTVALTVSLFVLSPIAGWTEESLTRRDVQGPVTVTVTLLAPPTTGVPLKAKVVLDTHSVGLDGVVFENAVALRSADGAEVAPTTVEQATGSGHHREAVLVFPAVGKNGPVRIVVKGVGGVNERLFGWEPSVGR